MSMGQSSKSIHFFYRRWYGVYQAMIFFVGHRRALTKYFFQSHLVSEMKVLDAGCGSGAATKALYAAAKRKGITLFTFHGFDFTEAAVNGFNTYAKRKRISAMKARLSNALLIDQSLPQDWRNYDFVISSGMLEYIQPDKLPLALSLLGQRMGTGGKMIIFISRPSTFNRLFLGRLWKANLYSKAELFRLFQEAGLHIQTIMPFQSWGFVVEAQK